MPFCELAQKAEVMEPQNPVRVYLVEDSPIILRLLVELIEPTGATVVGHADTASAAIADIAALHPDAATVHITLKQGNGFDVLQAIAVNSGGHPPLPIVLTDYMIDGSSTRWSLSDASVTSRP